MEKTEKENNVSPVTSVQVQEGTAWNKDEWALAKLGYKQGKSAADPRDEMRISHIRL